MKFPVDLLADVGQAKLEKLANDYMSELLYSNPDAPEHLTLSDSTQVTIDVFSVGLIPLYGSSDNPKVLALFSPGDTLNAVALYLLDRWWTVDDILLTADPKRDGVVEVKTLGERIVLYVLNRYIYRAQEKSPEELPFLCHGEKDHAKILWNNGEAVGFYSFKPSGSCDSYCTRRYQLSVMNSIYVRKRQRGKGFGLQMLEDFVLTFKGDCLGLRFPLTASMYKVCKKFLCQNPEYAHLLWEVEGIAAPNRRTNIANKIQAMHLSVSRELSFTEETQVTDETTDSDVVMEAITTQIKQAKSIESTVEIVEDVTVLKAAKEAGVPVTARGRSSGSKQRQMDAIIKEDKSEKVIRIEDIEAESPREAENDVQEKQLTEGLFREVHGEDVDEPDAFQDLEHLEEAPTASEPIEDDTTLDHNNGSQESQITVENVASEVEETEEEFDKGNSAVLVVSEEISALNKEAETLHKSEEETQIELADEKPEERVGHVTTGETGETGRTVVKAIQTVQSESIRRRSWRHKTPEEEKTSSQDGGRVLRGRTTLSTSTTKRKYTRRSQKVDELSPTEVVQSAVSEAEEQEEPGAEDTAEKETYQSEKVQKGEEGEKSLMEDKQDISDDVLEEPPVVHRRSRRGTPKPKPTQQSEKQKEERADDFDQGPEGSVHEEATNKQIEHKQAEQEEACDTAEEITVLKEGTIQNADEAESTVSSTEVNMEEYEKNQEVEETEGGAESASVIEADKEEEWDTAGASEPLKPTEVLEKAEPLDTENGSKAAETPECPPAEKENVDVIAAEEEADDLVQEEEACTPLPTQEEPSEVHQNVERVVPLLSELQRVSVCLVDLKQSHHEFQAEAAGKSEQSAAEGEEEQREETNKEEEEIGRDEEPNQAEGKQVEEIKASVEEDTSDEKIQEKDGEEAATEEANVEPEAEMKKAEDAEKKSLTEEYMVEETVSEACADAQAESPVGESTADSLNPDLGEVTSEEESPVVERQVLRSGRKAIKAKPRSKIPKSQEDQSEPQTTVEENDALRDEPTVETRILRKGRRSVPAMPRCRSKRAHVQCRPEEMEETEGQEEEEEQDFSEENKDTSEKGGECIEMVVDKEEGAEEEEVEDVAGDTMAEGAVASGREEEVVETVNESRTDMLQISAAEEVEINSAGKAEEDEINESAIQESALKAAESLRQEQPQGNKDKAEDSPAVEDTSLTSKRKIVGDKEDKEEDLPKRKSGWKRPRVDYRENNKEDEKEETDATDKDEVETDVDKDNSKENFDGAGENVDFLNLVLEADEREEKADSDQGGEEDGEDMSEAEENEPVVIGKRVLRGRSIPALVITPRSKPRRSSAKVHKAVKESMNIQMEEQHQTEADKQTSEMPLEDEAGGTQENHTGPSLDTTVETATGEMGELEDKEAVTTLVPLDKEHSAALEKCADVETDIPLIVSDGGDEVDGKEEEPPVVETKALRSETKAVADTSRLKKAGSRKEEEEKNEKEEPAVTKRTLRSGRKSASATAKGDLEESETMEGTGAEEDEATVEKTGKEEENTTEQIGEKVQGNTSPESEDHSHTEMAPVEGKDVVEEQSETRSKVLAESVDQALAAEGCDEGEVVDGSEELELPPVVMTRSMRSGGKTPKASQTTRSRIIKLQEKTADGDISRSDCKNSNEPAEEESNELEVEKEESNLVPAEGGIDVDKEESVTVEVEEAASEGVITIKDKNAAATNDLTQEEDTHTKLLTQEEETPSQGMQQNVDMVPQLSEHQRVSVVLVDLKRSHPEYQKETAAAEEEEEQREETTKVEAAKAQVENRVLGEMEKEEKQVALTVHDTGVDKVEGTATEDQAKNISDEEELVTKTRTKKRKQETVKATPRRRRGRPKRAEAEGEEASDAEEQVPVVQVRALRMRKPIAVTQSSKVDEEKEDDGGETSTAVEKMSQDGEEYAEEQEQISDTTQQLEDVDSEIGIEAAVLQQDTPEDRQVVEGETLDDVVGEAVEGEQSIPSSEVVTQETLLEENDNKDETKSISEESEAPVNVTRILRSGKKTVGAMRSKTPPKKDVDDKAQPDESTGEESGPEPEPAGESRVLRRETPRRHSKRAVTQFQPEEKEEEIEAQEEEEEQGLAEGNKETPEVEGERMEEEVVEGDDAAEEAAGHGGEDEPVEAVSESRTDLTKISVAEVEEATKSAVEADEKEITEPVSKETISPGEEQPEGDEDRALDSTTQDKAEDIQPTKRRSGRKKPRVDYKESDEDGEMETDATDKKDETEMDVDKDNSKAEGSTDKNQGAIDSSEKMPDDSLALDSDKQEEEVDSDKGDEEDRQDTSEEEEGEEPIVIGKRVLRGRSIPAMVITPHSKSRRSSRRHKAEESSSSDEEKSPKRSLRKRKIAEPTPTHRSKRRSRV